MEDIHAPHSPRPSEAHRTGAGVAKRDVATLRKRITRACDQCNQMRTKCDGQNPCAHCKGTRSRALSHRDLFMPADRDRHSQNFTLLVSTQERRKREARQQRRISTPKLGRRPTAPTPSGQSRGKLLLLLPHKSYPPTTTYLTEQYPNPRSVARDCRRWNMIHTLMPPR